MYVLMTYDVEARRTSKFRILLRKYLEHIQYSVFSGDLSEAKLIELRREISRLLKPNERVTEVSALNRNNIKITHFGKRKPILSNQKYTRICMTATLMISPYSIMIAIVLWAALWR